MAYAFRISDLARTLAQYPTVVTVMGNKIDVRTKEQLATLSSEITALEKLAAEGDAAISAGKCENAASLASRLSSSADQIASTLSAFAAQDNERLKSMSVVSRNKFNAYASSRLQAEKRFADEISKLLTQESQAVSVLDSGDKSSPDTKPDTKPDSLPDTKPKPVPETPSQPLPEPSLNDVIADMPGYLQVAYPTAAGNYDQVQLSNLCTSAGKSAISLGAQTSGGVSDFITASVLYGTDLPNQDWAKTILNDSEAGTVDDRMAILRNATESRIQVQVALAQAISQTDTHPEI